MEFLSVLTENPSDMFVYGMNMLKKVNELPVYVEEVSLIVLCGRHSY